MNVDFHVIIPARYQSSRLPGKLLMELDGVTILERVYLQAKKSNPKSIIIATDSEEIMAQAASFGARVILTSIDHQSGTDRIAEVISLENYAKDEIIVNVQGDEPFIAPELISQVALSIARSDTQMATLCWPIENHDMCSNPNIVKVVRDKDDNALYFSRSVIPFNRDEKENIDHIFRHIGLYAYKASFLKNLVTLPVCRLEAIEALEQLRVLWNGYKIKVDLACVPPLQDINTADDLEKAKLHLEKNFSH